MKKLLLLLMICFAVIPAFANYEFQCDFDSSGSPTIAVILGKPIEEANAYIWDFVNSAWIPQTVATDINCELNLILERTNRFWGSFPTGITTGGTYPVTYYRMALADVNLANALLINGDYVIWTGTAAVFPYAFTTDANKAAADANTTAVNENANHLVTQNAIADACDRLITIEDYTDPNNFLTLEDVNKGIVSWWDSNSTVGAAIKVNTDLISNMNDWLNNIWQGSGGGGFP